MNNMPLTLQIVTNLNCNLNCSYCYENKGRGKNDIWPIKVFLWQSMNQQEEPRDVVIDFIGGESLLYPELLDQLCDWALKLHTFYNKGKHLSFCLSTNGTLIAKDRKVQAFLLKWKPNVGFSIDGTKDIHDACRVDHDGKGSYDDAVAGYKWARKNLPHSNIGVKATYTHATIDRYAEGIKNLIDLGFTDIGANVVFEEVWTKEEAPKISEQMCQVVDYLFAHKLQDRVHIFQINHDGIDMRRYTADMGAKTSNHCGSCKYMRCIGYDGLIYGCNRFCTMKEPIPIGKVETEHPKLVIDGEDFIKEVSAQFDDWPEECKTCPYGSQCPSCSAIPYEQGGAKQYFANKPQCGFTHATVLARLYFKHRLAVLDAEAKA